MSLPPQIPKCKIFFIIILNSICTTGTIRTARRFKYEIPTREFQCYELRVTRSVEQEVCLYVITHVWTRTAFGSPDSKLHSFPRAVTVGTSHLARQAQQFYPTSTAPCIAWPLNTLDCTVALSQPRDKHLLKALSARLTLSNIRSYT
jgi:hypothetical protein